MRIKLSKKVLNAREIRGILLKDFANLIIYPIPSLYTVMFYGLVHNLELTIHSKSVQNQASCNSSRYARKLKTDPPHKSQHKNSL